MKSENDIEYAECNLSAYRMENLKRVQNRRTVIRIRSLHRIW